jgi:hypothetical protein
MKHQYTEAQKVRIRGMATAFQGAKAQLQRAVDFNGGICLALRFWQSGVPGSDRAAIDARLLVQRAIAGYAYLENWQRKSGRYRPNFRDFAIRHQWLDQLIRDCKAALEE